MSKKIIINTCYGGYGFSEEAYEWLIAHGIPVRSYKEEQRGEDGLFKETPENDNCILDREKDPSQIGKLMSSFSRYWDTGWTKDNREHPLLIQCIEELGEKASSKFAELKIVEIPDDVKYIIDEYDGVEHIAEEHRTWY